MRFIRRNLTYANLMATIAVFIVLGGGAVAAIQSKSSKARPLWAVVSTDGSLVRGHGAKSAKQPFGPGVGSYQVTFNRNVTGCGLVATLGRVNSAARTPDAGEIGVAYRHGDQRSVFVETRTSNGPPGDGSFHLAVLC